MLHENMETTTIRATLPVFIMEKSTVERRGLSTYGNYEKKGNRSNDSVSVDWPTLCSCFAFSRQRRDLYE